MISIVLIRPEVAGNVGAVARAMSNFGFSKLVIINPVCDIKSKECLDRAKHAKNIILNAKIGNEKLLEEFDYVIATTSQLGTD
ncbi:MAG: RNA methyltransferase, partial [Nanoarchaeota archaeon]